MHFLIFEFHWLNFRTVEKKKFYERGAWKRCKTHNIKHYGEQKIKAKNKFKKEIVS